MKTPMEKTMKQHRRIITAGAVVVCLASSALTAEAKTPPKAPKATPAPATPAPAPAPAPPAPPAAPAPLPPNTERGAYEQIKNMIYDAQYQQAHEASLRFLKKYTKSVNAEEVSFWKCYALQRATRD